jgi:predicted nucleotide-binding protein
MKGQKMADVSTEDITMSKIFIASSGRTLTLAQSLCDALQTNFCEATLWSEEVRNQPSATNIEMVVRTSQQYDFAVFIMSRDDLIVGNSGGDGTRKARDNCIFEVGIFIATLGQDRCFLVTGGSSDDLSSDLSGIHSLPLVEPRDLADITDCKRAIADVAANLKDKVLRTGILGIRKHVPLLSVNEVFSKERPKEDGGDLLEGQVVVCDLQPLAPAELAGQVSRNLDCGISYLYFLYFSEDTIEKMCKALQVILIGKIGETANVETRSKIIQEEKTRILDNLQRICRTGSLRVSLIPSEPQFCFRLHNASDPEAAKLYLKYGANSFILQAEGTSAMSVWKGLPMYFPGDTKARIFVPLRHFDIAHDDETKRQFNNWLDRGLKKYFPGIEHEVKSLYLGDVL